MAVADPSSRKPRKQPFKAGLQSNWQHAQTVAIELHRQQIDPIISLASDIRQRTVEPQLAKRGNKTRFQRGSFRHGSSASPVKRRRPGCRLLSQPRSSAFHEMMSNE
jgi:hypothetical protein